MKVAASRRDLFHVVEEFEGARIAFGERFLEIAAEAEMAAVDHVRIDVAPNFGEIRDGADFAIEIRDWRNRDIGAHSRRAGIARWAQLRVLESGSSSTSVSTCVCA